jgi:hypothetical protein
MRKKIRPTEEHLMRLAVHAHKRYTPLKLNDKIVEDDVTVTQEDMNTCKKNCTWKTARFSTGKLRGQRILPILAFHRIYLS